MADYGLNFSVAPSEDDDSDRTPRTMDTYSDGACKAVKLEPMMSAGRRSVTMELGSPKRAIPAGGGMIVSSRSRKPRGRPLGSKNKPRPPIVIHKESESGLKSVVIEISAGSDVVESLVQFARANSVGISVLSGCGSVSDVILRQHSTLSHHGGSASPALLSLHGPLNVLSLSGSFVENTTCSFGICLAGSKGQVFGGIIGGKVIAASLVVVVAATFIRPKFHKLPDVGDACEDDSDDDHNEIKPLLGGGAYALSQETVAMSAATVASSSTGAYSGSVATTTVPPQLPGMNCQVTHQDHQMVMPWGAPPARPHHY